MFWGHQDVCIAILAINSFAWSSLFRCLTVYLSVVHPSDLLSTCLSDCFYHVCLLVFQCPYLFVCQTTHLFFETLYGGQFTLPIQLTKPKLSYHSSVCLLQGEPWIKSWEAIHIVFGGSGVEIVAFGILGDRRLVWDFNNYFSGGTINTIIWIFPP